MAGLVSRVPWVPVVVGLVVAGGGAGVVGYAGGSLGIDVILLLLVLGLVAAVALALHFNVALAACRT